MNGAFCTNCGASVQQQAPPPVQYTPPPVQQQAPPQQFAPPPVQQQAPPQQFAPPPVQQTFSPSPYGVPPPVYQPVVKKSKTPIFVALGIAVTGIVIAIIIVASGILGSNRNPEPINRDGVVIVTPEPASAVLTPAQVYENNHASVFQVFYHIDEYYVGWGSGFFISESGVAVTNHHVMDGADSAIVILEDGSEYDIIGYYSYDIGNDLAIIQIDGGGRRFQPVTIGVPEALSVGDRVYAIGGPGGDPLTLTEGIISRFAYEPINYSFYTIAGMLQSTAFIYGGNSGGPLFNDRGHVVGVNSAGRSDRESTQWAVPIDRIEIPVAGAMIHSLPVGTFTPTHAPGQIFGFERFRDIPDFLSVSENASLLLSGTAADLGFDLVLDLDEEGKYSFDYAYLFSLPEDDFIPDTDLYDDVLGDNGFIFQDVIVTSTDDELDETYVFLFNSRLNLSLVYLYFWENEALLILIGQGNTYEIIVGTESGQGPDHGSGSVITETDLHGVWTFYGGDLTYFFWFSDFVFFGEHIVYIISDINDDDDDGTHGTWSISGNRLTVTDENGVIYEFTIDISGNILSITDSDNDTGLFERVS